MWEGLPSLKILGLADNFLSIVPHGCFQNLFNLVELDLNRNLLPTREPENFSELGKLQLLWLRENDLVVIRGNMWIWLDSLTHLDLYENKITVIERGGFANLPMIETIVLNRNKLTTLSPDAFCLSSFPNPTVPPLKLTLLLDDVYLARNSSLCWLKEAEKNRLITYAPEPDPYSWPHRVMCVNFRDVPWDDVVLDCMDVGAYTSYQ